MMPRLSVFSPNELSNQQKSLYRNLTGGTRSKGIQHFSLTDSNGGLVGPFNSLLTNPAIGDAVQALGGALRFSGLLSNQAREAVILAVAKHHHSDFEWEAHVRIARSIGLSEQVIASLSYDGETTAIVDPVDSVGPVDPVDSVDSVGPVDVEVLVAISAARILLHSGDLNDEQFTQTKEYLDDGTLVEVMALVSYYGLLATIMRVFRVDERIPEVPTQESVSGEQGPT